jgi:DNA invertase Pin-like site-specific DNA recombinase
MLTPIQTASGRRIRVESIKVANIVLSGSSAKKIATNTSTALLSIRQFYVKTMAIRKQMKTQKGLIQLINNNDNIQHLVVFSPDRLSRNFYDFIDLNKLLDEQKITLHFVKDNLISSNSNNLLEIRSKIQEAQNENEIRGIRNSKIIQKQKLNGTYLPPVCKFGYKYVYQIKNGKQHKQLDKNPKEQLIIQLIKELDHGTVKNVNSLIQKITGKNPEYIFDDPDCDNIDSGNVRYIDIAKILNENGITRRNFKWTGFSIKEILHMKN